MEIITTQAVRFEQSGRTLYTAAMPAGRLLDVAEVDVWDPDIEPISSEDLERQGYQRSPVKSHLGNVARFLHNEPDPLLPTNILLSARTGLEFEVGDGNIGTLSIDENDLPLYVVDGQHRLFGLELAVEKYGDESLYDFVLPVTIVDGIPKVEEIRQFFVINTTAKRIRTDLAQRLLLELAEQEEEVRGQVVARGQKWRLQATKITSQLNDSPGSPWEGRIKPPNSSGRSDAIATETSVATSLKPILTGGFTAELEDEKVTRLIQRLWTAIGELMPEAIEDPGDYVLQKTPGIYTIHMVAPRIFELCREQSDYSVAGIKAILTGTEEAQEYFARSEFWLGRAGGGEAAMYNSMGAFRQLADDIEQTLPELTVDIAI